MHKDQHGRYYYYKGPINQQCGNLIVIEIITSLLL